MSSSDDDVPLAQRNAVTAAKKPTGSWALQLMAQVSGPGGQQVALHQGSPRPASLLSVSCNMHAAGAAVPSSKSQGAAENGISNKPEAAVGAQGPSTHISSSSYLKKSCLLHDCSGPVQCRPSWLYKSSR